MLSSPAPWVLWRQDSARSLRLAPSLGRSAMEGQGSHNCPRLSLFICKVGSQHHPLKGLLLELEGRHVSVRRPGDAGVRTAGQGEAGPEMLCQASRDRCADDSPALSPTTQQWRGLQRDGGGRVTRKVVYWPCRVQGPHIADLVSLPPWGA